MVDDASSRLAIRRVGIGCIIALVIGELLSFCYSGTVATMWAMASSGVGAVIGFIFGIPKLLQADQSSGSGQGGTPSPQLARYSANTNLEQISDWLTKIIVGISLVNATALLGHFRHAVEQLAAGLPPLAATTVPASASDANTTFAYALVVYFLITGFFAGYLLTRLNLARLFSIADDVDARDRQVTTVDSEVVLSELEPGELPGKLPPDVEAAVQQRLNDPNIGKSNSVPTLLADAKVLYAADKIDEAITALDRARALAPRNTDALFYLCHVMLSKADGAGKIELECADLLRELVRRHGARAVAWKLLGYCLLWDATELKDAADASKAYLGLFPLDNGAKLNLACAIARAEELHQPWTAGLPVPDQVIALIKEIHESDPRWDARIRTLLDDDLRSIKSDPRITEILGADTKTGNADAH